MPFLTYAAWWLFVISMTTTSALALASSGSCSSIFHSELDKYSSLLDAYSNLQGTYSERLQGGGSSDAKQRKWLPQQLSVIGVAFSLIGAAGGWGLLAAGLLEVNLHFELEGKGLGVSGGPDHGEGGIGLASRLGTYFTIGGFGAALIGAYIFRLWLTRRKSSSAVCRSIP